MVFTGTRVFNKHGVCKHVNCHLVHKDLHLQVECNNERADKSKCKRHVYYGKSADGRWIVCGACSAFHTRASVDPNQ